MHAIAEPAHASTPKRVLFFGFSITEQPGYVPSLRARLGERDVHVESRAIGGINLRTLPYLQSLLSYESYDHVVFEVTTCRRYAESDPESYGEVLERVIDQVRASGAEPAFVHLFRKGVDYRDDRMLAIADKLCEARKVPSVNLVPQLVEFERTGLLLRYLRDGIHTTAEGADYYAGALLPFLDALVDDGRAPRTGGTADPDPGFAIVPIDRLLPERELSMFKRGNLVMPCVEIPEGESLKLSLPGGCAFDGLLFLRTPRAGILEVTPAGSGMLQVHAFDQHSYYRRYATWTSPPGTAAASVTIRQLATEPDVTLVKGERDAGPKIGEVCGVLVRTL